MPVLKKAKHFYNKILKHLFSIFAFIVNTGKNLLNCLHYTSSTWPSNVNHGQELDFQLQQFYLVTPINFL